jgi:hypothetical protein
MTWNQGIGVAMAIQERDKLWKAEIDKIHKIDEDIELQLEEKDKYEIILTNPNFLIEYVIKIFDYENGAFHVSDKKVYDKFKQASYRLLEKCSK